MLFMDSKGNIFFGDRFTEPRLQMIHDSIESVIESIDRSSDQRKPNISTRTLPFRTTTIQPLTTTEKKPAPFIDSLNQIDDRILVKSNQIDMIQPTPQFASNQTIEKIDHFFESDQWNQSSAIKSSENQIRTFFPVPPRFIHSSIDKERQVRNQEISEELNRNSNATEFASNSRELFNDTLIFTDYHILDFNELVKSDQNRHLSDFTN